ncbi:hypothetical protein [Streptomyces sp. NBC_00503]|nr:hypothetical protein [Streptomyces sp. NBC_00503]WUD82122.1 hypothetical protein OG490_17105 [Streptomyces sp. NBC_00503]
MFEGIPELINGPPAGLIRMEDRPTDRSADARPIALVIQLVIHPAIGH